MSFIIHLYRNRDTSSAIYSELEESLASLRIESVHNSGHPDNYCVPTKPDAEINSFQKRKQSQKGQ